MKDSQYPLFSSKLVHHSSWKHLPSCHSIMHQHHVTPLKKQFPPTPCQILLLLLFFLHSLQPIITFLPKMGFMNITSNAAEAAQGCALSDQGQCWHICSLSSSLLHGPRTDRKLLVHLPSDNRSRKGLSRETALTVAPCVWFWPFKKQSAPSSTTWILSRVINKICWKVVYMLYFYVVPLLFSYVLKQKDNV